MNILGGVRYFFLSIHEKKPFAPGSRYLQARKYEGKIYIRASTNIRYLQSFNGRRFVSNLMSGDRIAEIRPVNSTFDNRQSRFQIEGERGIDDEQNGDYLKAKRRRRRRRYRR